MYFESDVQDKFRLLGLNVKLPWQALEIQIISD